MGGWLWASLCRTCSLSYLGVERHPIFIYVTSRVSCWALLSSSPKAAGWCAFSSGWPFSGRAGRLGEMATPLLGGLQIVVLVYETQNGEGVVVVETSFPPSCRSLTGALSAAHWGEPTDVAFGVHLPFSSGSHPPDLRSEGWGSVFPSPARGSLEDRTRLGGPP